MTDNARPKRPPVARPPAFPAVLVAACLAVQLLLLAWSAFPAATMKRQQPLESWLFLAGGQGLFVSWLWPMCRVAGRAGWRQVALEAVLIVAASVPPAVLAILWTDPSPGQIAAPAGYLLAWLLAAAVATACPAAVRWAYGLLVGLANLAVVGLGYLWLDLLGSGAMAMWQFSPMYEASRLAEVGLPAWPVAPADMLAGLAPLFVLLALVFVLLGGSLFGPPSGPAAVDAANRKAEQGHAE